jgi:glycosyltransferase involved in cell wall biosynthesis
MKRRLVILTEIISPYRIPLFNQLAVDEDTELHVIFLAETDPKLRQWRVYKEEIRFSYEVLPSWRARWGRHNVLLNRGVPRALAAARPDVLLCGGYNYVASWQALRWARNHRVPFLLWSESNLQDSRQGRRFTELLKRKFLGMCDAFVVPGESAAEYLRAHNIPQSLIFTAPNAVDNDRFAAGATVARENAAALRLKLGLPECYFLFVGRLVPEKGVFDLLSAYAKLDACIRERVGLVFVGDGESRRRLEKQALSASAGKVIFAGFAQRDELPAYYALARALILPTHTDPWGLVVNEAMACGLPVILSRAAGCANDLLKEGWNGFSISAADIGALEHSMKKMVSPQLANAMGVNSSQQILQYSPATWSAGVTRAVCAQWRQK